jgi:glycosyltransferase involved in cell wall biosynthesis
MHKLLLIAYYFPPDGGGGTQRPAKFCRYLPEFNWQVTVITRTATLRKKRGRWDPPDESMLGDVEPAEIIRVEQNPRDAQGEWPAELLRTDPEAAWMSPVYRTAHHAINRGEADAVLITMSPFCLNHLGRRLHNVTGVPVIYDLRDPWALDGWQPKRTKWHWLREMQMMKLTLESASGVIANTPQAGKQMLANFPGLKPARMDVITNGYDVADFGAAWARLNKNQSDEFLLVHTGTLHGHVLFPPNAIKTAIKKLVNYSPEQIVPSGRTVVHLLAAMKNVSRKVRLVLVGEIDASTQRCIDESGMSDRITCTGYVSHTESVCWLLRADGLFLPLHDLPDGERSLIVPGKTYEYLAAGRPILGCLPHGDARDLVEASGMGYLARPTDETQIAHALQAMPNDWSTGKYRDARPAEWIAHYERKALTEKLAAFLDRVISMKQRKKREAAIAL